MNPEWIGMIGTVLLAVSISMSSMTHLRLINIASNITFIVYALLFTPILMSILATNVIIMAIHVYKLYVEHRARQETSPRT